MHECMVCLFCMIKGGRILVKHSTADTDLSYRFRSLSAYLTKNTQRHGYNGFRSNISLKIKMVWYLKRKGIA